MKLWLILLVVVALLVVVGIIIGIVFAVRRDDDEKIIVSEEEEDPYQIEKEDPEQIPEQIPEQLPIQDQKNYSWQINKNYNPLKDLNVGQAKYLGQFDTVEECQQKCDDLTGCSAFVWGHPDSSKNSKVCLGRNKFPHVWKKETNKNYKVTGGLKMYNKPTNYTWQIQDDINTLKGVKEEEIFNLGIFENKRDCKYACELDQNCGGFRWIKPDSKIGTPKKCKGTSKDNVVWRKEDRPKYIIASGRKKFI